MEKKTSLSIQQIVNGEKPINKFSSSILKNTVGLKAKNNMSGTLGSISSMSQNRLAKRQETLEHINNNPRTSSIIKAISKGNIGEVEEDIPLDKYLANDSDSSDFSEEEGCNGGPQISVTGGESIISVKDLIDNNLTELLNTMKKFPPSTQE